MDGKGPWGADREKKTPSDDREPDQGLWYTEVRQKKNARKATLLSKRDKEWRDLGKRGAGRLAPLSGRRGANPKIPRPEKGRPPKNPRFKQAKRKPSCCFESLSTTGLPASGGGDKREDTPPPHRIRVRSLKQKKKKTQRSRKRFPDQKQSARRGNQANPSNHKPS